METIPFVATAQQCADRVEKDLHPHLAPSYNGIEIGVMEGRRRSS